MSGLACLQNIRLLFKTFLWSVSLLLSIVLLDNRSSLSGFPCFLLHSSLVSHIPFVELFCRLRKNPGNDHRWGHSWGLGLCPSQISQFGRWPPLETFTQHTTSTSSKQHQHLEVGHFKLHLSLIYDQRFFFCRVIIFIFLFPTDIILMFQTVQVQTTLMFKKTNNFPSFYMHVWSTKPHL